MRRMVTVHIIAPRSQGFTGRGWHGTTAPLNADVAAAQRCAAHPDVLWPSSDQRSVSMAEKTAPSNDDLDQATERIRELNEKILEQGRELGGRFLDAYEESLKAFADAQLKLAEATGQDWVSDIARAQADFVRNISEAYISNARQMLKS